MSPGHTHWTTMRLLYEAISWVDEVDRATRCIPFLEGNPRSCLQKLDSYIFLTVRSRPLEALEWCLPPQPSLGKDKMSVLCFCFMISYFHVLFCPWAELWLLCLLDHDLSWGLASRRMSRKAYFCCWGRHKIFLLNQFCSFYFCDLKAAHGKGPPWSPKIF